jgi:hypothetical protein
MANAELLKKVLQHIKDNPDDFDPIRWHKDFAGWTLRLAMPGVEVRKDDMDIETMYDADGAKVWATDIGPQAQKLLGINSEQALKLFCGGNRIEDLERYVSAFTAAEVSA